jgi:opacity protein-like surface antigen
MMSRFLGAVSFAAMCLTAPQALAADVLDVVDFDSAVMAPTMYASVFAGFVAPTKITGAYYGSSVVDLDAGFGFVGGVAVGTNILPNARVEGELSFTHQGIDDDNFMRDWECDPVDACASTGSLSTIYLLGNIWWDFDLGGGITPYIGAGIGAALVKPNVTLYPADPEYSWDMGSLAPAAQLGAGVVVDVADNMKVDLGYRAKAVLGATFSDSEFSCDFSGPGLGACSAVDMMYVQHILQAGLTLEF